MHNDYGYTQEKLKVPNEWDALFTGSVEPEHAQAASTRGEHESQGQL